jgi:hypothetical protein
MNIKDFYLKTESNYNKAYDLFFSDDLIKKYIIKFKSDDTFKNLEQAFNNKDYAKMFMYSHALKGIALNLSLTKFYEATNELTDSLRNNNIPNDLDLLYNRVLHEYNNIIKYISSIE